MIEKEIFSNFYSKNYIDNLNKKIKKLGSKSTLNINTFINVRIILSLISFVVCFSIESLVIVSPFVAILVYFLFEYFVLTSVIQKRKILLEEDSVMFFETLLLSISDGKSLKNSIKLTTDIFDNELSFEFKGFLDNINNGRSFNESFDELKNYVPSESIDSLILSLKESYELGIKLESSLLKEINYLRDKRMYLFKEKINVISIRFTIITMIILVPTIILLLLGPVLLGLL
ncbi:hypothetical protein EOM09_06155 [bacterium]|nr:hypothetical protein [bacterium]